MVLEPGAPMALRLQSNLMYVLFSPQQLWLTR